MDDNGDIDEDEPGGATVERPRLEALGMDLPGGGDVDYFDDDRLKISNR